MAKTVDLTRTADNSISIVINSQAPKTLYNPNNLIIKPLVAGAIVKISDESWRQEFSLTDTVTEAGVAKSPFANVTALVAYLTGFFHN